MILNRFFRIQLFCVCLLCSVLTSGCMSNFQKIADWEHFPWSDKPARSAEKEAETNEFLFHRIRWQGETLSIIAKWYTGSMEDWKLLSRINPGLAPQNLQVGEKVKIPANRVKTSVEMPRDFVRTLAANSGNSEKQDSGNTEKEDKPPADKAEKEPELFGPKELNDK